MIGITNKYNLSRGGGGGDLPNGKTVLPVNDVPTLLACGGLSALGYTTLQQLCNDKESFLNLCAVNNAVDYLVRCDSFITTICADATLVGALGSTNYCAITFMQNIQWLTAICASENWYLVCSANVKKNIDSNKCIGSSQYASNCGFPHAYETNVNNLGWSANTGPIEGGWIGYRFNYLFTVRSVCFRSKISSDIKPSSSGLWRIRKFKLQGSNDGTNWEDASSVYASLDTMDLCYYAVDCDTKYLFWRLYAIEGTDDSSNWPMIHSLDFLGRVGV